MSAISAHGHRLKRGKLFRQLHNIQQSGTHANIQMSHLSIVPVRGSTCTQLPDSAEPQYTSAQQRPSIPRRDRAHIEPASCLSRHSHIYFCSLTYSQ